MDEISNEMNMYEKLFCEKVVDELDGCYCPDACHVSAYVEDNFLFVVFDCRFYGVTFKYVYNSENFLERMTSCKMNPKEEAYRALLFARKQWIKELFPLTNQKGW